MTERRPDPESAADDANDAEEDATLPPESKWLRVRRSSLIRFDKIAQVSIQRRNDNFFLEIRADRDIYLPLPNRRAGLRALRALEEGTTDISEWVIPRDFMQSDAR